MLMLTRITEDTSYWGFVLPSLLLMSIGMAGVFITASSTSLVGIGTHDAGVASALLNTSQQVGGSLGTALLNTLYAGAVTAYLTDHVTESPKTATGNAFVHGYHIAFFWGAMLLAVSLLVAVFLMNAKKEDVPADAVAPA